MLLDNLFSVRSIVGLALALVGIATVLAVPSLQNLRYRRLVAAATGLLLFQVFHFAEHAIQLAAWFGDPQARPYMTPWAQSGADGLGLWATILPGLGTMMMRGMELLHLIGNTLFLVGLLALGHLAPKGLPGLRAAKWIQSAHVAEHVVLTLSVFLLGDAIGLSTVFGVGEGTSWGPTLRVWFHFLINLAGTIPAVIALLAFRRSHRPPEPNTSQHVRNPAPTHV